MQRIASEGVLRELQKHPEAWTRVDRILELSQSQQAKFIALQVRHAAAPPGLLRARVRLCGLRSARAYISALALAGSCLHGVHAARPSNPGTARCLYAWLPVTSRNTSNRGPCGGLRLRSACGSA